LESVYIGKRRRKRQTIAEEVEDALAEPEEQEEENQTGWERKLEKTFRKTSIRLARTQDGGLPFFKISPSSSDGRIPSKKRGR
jgi:hypothetical protein